jgi:(p)ppGpp synthase/HD superfamily hydrolase
MEKSGITEPTSPTLPADLGYVLSCAIEIAAKAHALQKDKEGKPYILHPLRVMMAVESLEDKIVAVLHDVIEDTSITASDLLIAGIPTHLVTDVEMVSRAKDSESHWDFIKRIVAVGSDRALRVKVADVIDNSDVRRTEFLDEKDCSMANRCVKTYRMLKDEQRRRDLVFPPGTRASGFQIGFSIAPAKVIKGDQ